MPSRGTRSVGSARPSPKSNHRRTPCSRDTTRRFPTMATSPPSEGTSTGQSTLWSEEPPASPSPSPDSARDWMTTVATWPSNFVGLLAAYGHSGSFGKMCLGSCPLSPTTLPIRVSISTEWEVTPPESPGTGVGFCSPVSTTRRKAMRSSVSWPRFKNSAMGSPTAFLTLSTSEWNHTLTPSRSDGAVCSLSDILETGAHLAPYFSSRKACAGILRRAAKRGRALPDSLHRALEHVAQTTTKPKPDTS